MADGHSPSNNGYKRKPEWLRIKLPSTDEYAYLKGHLNKHHLHTICESGNCPNLGECWAAKTATFMILGNTCTRNCRFCNVEHGHPSEADADEPHHIADAVLELGIRHCVLTSVTRDDLPDGGAQLWHETIAAVKAADKSITIEALIPDLKADPKLLKIVADAGPEVIAHNLETVARLTPLIRNNATYDRSLKVLSLLSGMGHRTKTGIMVGLGETDQEVIDTLFDIYKADCKIVTIGQYLQPTKTHWPVDRYVSPDQFIAYREKALSIGFKHVESAPLVRSSYHAEKHSC